LPPHIAETWIGDEFPTVIGVKVGVFAEEKEAF
jgi:hypothetical protein